MVVFGQATVANHVSTVDLAHTLHSSFNQSKFSLALYSCQELFQRFFFVLSLNQAPLSDSLPIDTARFRVFSAHMRGTPPRTVLVSVIQPYQVQHSIDSVET